MSDSTTAIRACNVCGKSFPRTTEYWHKNKRNRDGLHFTCKACAKVRASQHYRANPQKVIATAKEWRANNPEKVLDIYKRFAETHREQERLRAKTFRETKRGQRRLIQLRYRLSHIEQIRAHNNCRRDAPGSFTAEDIRVQIKAQDGCCWWCGKKLERNYHIDHRIPIIKGGTNEPGNLCISCPECNLSKGIKLPHEWNGRLL